MPPHPTSPAFPCVTNHEIYMGMSIRTWLVGQALQGLSGCLVPDDPEERGSVELCRVVGECAVRIADAALAAMGREEADRPY